MGPPPALSSSSRERSSPGGGGPGGGSRRRNEPDNSSRAGEKRHQKLEREGSGTHRAHAPQPPVETSVAARSTTTAARPRPVSQSAHRAVVRRPSARLVDKMNRDRAERELRGGEPEPPERSSSSCCSSDKNRSGGSGRNHETNGNHFGGQNRQQGLQPPRRDQRLKDGNKKSNGGRHLEKITGQPSQPQRGCPAAAAPNDAAAPAAQLQVNSSRPGAYCVEGSGVTSLHHAVETAETIAPSENIPTAFLVQGEDDGGNDREGSGVVTCTAREVKRVMSRRFIVLIVVAAVLAVGGLVAGIILGMSKSEGIQEVPPAAAEFAHTESSLLDLVVTSSRDGGAAVNDQNSPQAAAYQWLWMDPNLANYSDARIMERYALATLYMSAGGTDWKNNTGWMSYDVPECSWANIQCNNVYDRVERIIMEKHGLVGTVPGEIFHHLTDLFELSLSDNQLFGTLSEDLGVSLGWFRLHDNMLSGTLPNAAFEHLTKLRSIHLYRNQFSGPIVESIAELSDLQVLRLSDNKLTGSLDTRLGQLLNLESLWLSDNRLTSTLPSELGKLHRLDTLYVHDNNLVGRIPSELGLLSKMTDMTFHGNTFTGTMADEVCALRDRSLAQLFANCRTGGTNYLPCDCCTACCKDGKKCMDP